METHNSLRAQLNSMYGTILVALDGSEESHTALEHSFDVAESSGATVHVLTVVDTANPIQFGIEEVEKLDSAATDLVEDIVDAYADHDIDIRGDVRRGTPAPVLLEYAAEIDADLIIAGQRGSSGLTGALLGSTTDRLSRMTDRPLLIVPAGEETDTDE